MRTVKRQTETINAAKRVALESLCSSYAREKQYWLDTLRGKDFQSKLNAPRKIRDELIQNKYQSRYGLQARHWKLALQDGIETWTKYWESLFVDLRSKISCHFKVEEERHYAFWLLFNFKQFTACMKGETPLPSFSIDPNRAKKISAYVQRKARKLKGASPRVQKSKLIKFDADCYEVFEQGKRQYIKLMSLQKGKRIVIPLKGISKIEGNIALVFKENSVEILVSQEVKKKPRNKEKAHLVGVDFGYSEVMTDAKNNRYGTGLGSILTKTTDDLNQKMKRRHKLYALEKKGAY